MRFDLYGIIINLEDEIVQKYCNISFPDYDVKNLSPEQYNRLHKRFSMLMKEKAEVGYIEDLTIDIDNQRYSSEEVEGYISAKELEDAITEMILYAEGKLHVTNWSAIANKLQDEGFYE